MDKNDGETDALGRVKEITGISFTHLIILVAAYSLVVSISNCHCLPLDSQVAKVFICLCLVNLRYRKRRNKIKHIPRLIMPYLKSSDIPAVHVSNCTMKLNLV